MSASDKKPNGFGAYDTPTLSPHETQSSEKGRARIPASHHPTINATDLALPFLRKFQSINRQRLNIQRLRVRAGEARESVGKMRGRHLRVAVALNKILENANIPEETRAQISSEVDELGKATEEISNGDISCDVIDGELLPVEWRIKESEISLYGQFGGSPTRTESEVDTVDKTYWMIPRLQTLEAMELDTDEQNPALPPEMIELESEPNPRDEALIPIDWMRQDIDHGLVNQVLGLDLTQETNPDNEFGITVHRHGSQSIDFRRADSQPLDHRGSRITNDHVARLSATTGQLHTRLAKLEEEYLMLHEEAQRRIFVGVPLDDDLQQLLSSYPYRRGLLWKKLADLEDEGAAVQRAVDRGEYHTSLLSKALFQLDQFVGVSTDQTSDQLSVDEDDDGTAMSPRQDGFEVRANDLWPVTSSIPLPKVFKEWFSKTSDSFHTRRSFIYAYISFWFLTCLQASWLSCARFVYNNYLDQKLAFDYDAIKKFMLRTLLSSDDSDSDLLPFYQSSRSLNTASLPTDELESSTELSKRASDSYPTSRKLNGSQVLSTVRTQSLRAPNSRRSVTSLILRPHYSNNLPNIGRRITR